MITFREKGKSLTLIEKIVALAVEQRDLQSTGKAFESVLGRCQRLCYDLKDLLQPYQERGVFLDAHMADLTSPLIAFIVDQVSRKEPHAWPKSCHLICSTLYLIFKVRGLSKAPFGHFPHEISLIEPVLDQAEVLLLTESGNEGSEALEGWESKTLEWQSEAWELEVWDIIVRTAKNFPQDGLASRDGSALPRCSDRGLLALELSGFASDVVVGVAGQGTAPLHRTVVRPLLYERIRERLSPRVLSGLDKLGICCCTTALQGHCERLHRAAALCLARLIAREDILQNSVKNDFFAQLSLHSVAGFMSLRYFNTSCRDFW
ncbi:hypothetical protein FOZ63_033718 [Perkinsus olseni]|uniref:Uncharacterized protein n=1 Tax=Perkinsus olseni TaxID=32597 RepID=A0A7J6QKN9_PEROL|nr:hypothetical protein FOZ63_033718 [Perkinsus olseni]